MAQDVDASLLALLGLDPDEEAVYQLLVDRPDSEPAVLAGPLSDYAVARALDVLVERGLASAHRPEGQGVPRYRATSPALALGPLLESRRSALHRVEYVVADLAERHRLAQVRASGAPVEVLSGAIAIRRRIIAMQRQARQEVCALVPMRRASSVAISLEDNFEEVERESMRRGVTIRSVVERGWLDGPQTAASLGEMAAQGQRIAVVEKIPIKIIIADRRVALLPLDPERDETEPIALVVHRSGLLTALTALTALFEQCFERGRRLRGPGAPTWSPSRTPGSTPSTGRSSVCCMSA